MNEIMLKTLPEKAIDALKRWDSDTLLWSVELGGLGPSYEQSIQFSAFEIIRHFKGVAPKGNEKQIQNKLDKALSEIDKKFDLGHSGASAGASEWLAYRFMKAGYRETIRKCPENQLIQVVKTFNIGRRTSK